MEVRLIQAVETDAAVSVWEAANVARGKAPDAARIARVREKLVEPDARAYVAVEASVLGMALLEPTRAADGRGPVIPGLLHVSMVFVHPKAQRQGVGRALVSNIFAAAREQQLEGISLWTSAENLGAKRLYEGLGVKLTRKRPVGEGAWWVRYELLFTGW